MDVEKDFKLIECRRCGRIVGVVKTDTSGLCFPCYGSSRGERDGTTDRRAVSGDCDLAPADGRLVIERDTQEMLGGTVKEAAAKLVEKLRFEARVL